MKRRDGSDKKMRIINRITAHKSFQCVDFGHLLLNDGTVVKKLQDENNNNNDFIRAVLDKWLSRDDDDKEESPPCTWEALVQCAEDAELDGEFVKLLRDNVL